MPVEVKELKFDDLDDLKPERKKYLMSENLFQLDLESMN